MSTTNSNIDGSIKLQLFKNLMASLQASTQASMDPAVPPILAILRDELKDVQVDLVDATKKLCIEELTDDEFRWSVDGLTTRKDTRTGKDKDKTLLVDSNNPSATTGAVINWLVKTLDVCVEKINSHSIVIDAILLHHEADVKKLKEENTEVVEKCSELEEKNDENVVEINKLKEDKVKVEKKCEELKVEKDEIRQRGMKGNLIISTNTRDGRASGFKRLEPRGPDMVVEEELDMVPRGVRDHTGIAFHNNEVQDFHPNGDRRNPTSYTLRIWDRRPGSSWEALKAGMRNWTKPDGNKFNSDVNIRVNFQLTKPRAQLGKLVRLTRAQLFKENILKHNQHTGVVFKYNHDDNGVLRVKSKEGRVKWDVITSMEQFTTLVKDTYNFTIPPEITNNIINSQ